MHANYHLVLHSFLHNRFACNSVIDGNTNEVVKTIHGIQNPYTDVYNPHNGDVYVTTALGVDTAYVIDGDTDEVED